MNAAAGVVGRGVDEGPVAGVATLFVVHPASPTVTLANAPASTVLRSGRPEVSIDRSVPLGAAAQPCVDHGDCSAPGR
ncbi:hypothetical protein [Streptomyces sp. A1136]|uniref:hypothetical protein n=1 Tax=Streptomyces sp. A1136 TaxID=2563102 RepID=UPI00109E6BDE|nr:hypothetical protein [Streptomyces sp. A1136]THA51423.1 hypothetical protein E6R62_23220 [Streptomyces sp. A1136]